MTWRAAVVAVVTMGTVVVAAEAMSATTMA